MAQRRQSNIVYLEIEPDVAYHEWTPTITNFQTNEVVESIVGNALETGDGIFFDAQFVAKRSDTDEWTLMKPRLSLPVAAADVAVGPTRMVGGGQGYGGSEQKFFETLFSKDTPTNLGSVYLVHFTR